GIVVAQDVDKGKPLLPGSGLDAQCETAVKSKDYLKDLKITFKEEGAGKVACEGAVPTKVHACAVFLTCMGVHGVGMVDLSKLRIEHWGSETAPPPNGTKPGTDVRGGL